MQPLIRRFDLHVAPDVRHVPEAARALGIAEFELFRLAYRFWYRRELREAVLDEAFAQYLLKEKVPVWVRDYCRRVLNLDAVGQLDPRDFGVDTPRKSGSLLAEQLYASFITLFAILVYLFFLA